jgi:hypothetical protein
MLLTGRETSSEQNTDRQIFNPTVQHYYCCCTSVSNLLLLTKKLGSYSRQGHEVISLLYNVQSDSAAHPVSSVVGIGGAFTGIKRQGCEADH